ncbi:MAG: IFT57 family protein [Gammaproteobacteria bacterium]|nr:IFT57 family protein [Gammaproteobacteria bacterium]
MQGIVKYSSIIALSMAMTVGLSACGNPFSKKSSNDNEVVMSQSGPKLWESNLQYVRLVERDQPGTNQHPLPINSDEMREILSSMYVNQRVLLRTQQVPLFSPGELQILSSTLAQGLSRAQPNEDITFVTLGVHAGAIAAERKTNSGRVFIDSNGRLNIIFGLVHQEYRDKDQITGQEIDRRVNPLMPGSRRSDSRPATRVALDNGQSYYEVDGSERSDWLVIDIPTVLATAAERKGQDTGALTPEMREEIARTKRQTDNLTDDVANIKEVLFEMSEQLEQLKQQLEDKQ